MKLYSTNRKAKIVGLQEAIFKGLPEDNGLYMPTKIPKMSASFFREISRLSFPEIAYEVTKTLIGEDVDNDFIRTLAEESFNFSLPLHRIGENAGVLELFHGPTLAFKDFGARFMARLMSYFRRSATKDLHILVATSGDTGGAVANGFLSVPGIKVTILYPDGKVSDFQERQLTTMGSNITALKVKGSFDDCQAMVKSAFLDEDVRNNMDLTSANSINISRLIPQSFYYFGAASLIGSDRGLIFVTPSGNLGNLCAGVLAMKMGLKVKNFVASTNRNATVPNYLHSGKYQPSTSFATISNAMDVGDPSNFQRLTELFENDFSQLAEKVKGYSFDDQMTKREIKTCFSNHNYVICPHTAVGLLGWKKYLENQKIEKSDFGVVLSTAHPAKFAKIVGNCIRKEVTIPFGHRDILKKEKDFTEISNQYKDLKSYLMSLS